MTMNFGKKTTRLGKECITTIQGLCSLARVLLMACYSGIILSWPTLPETGTVKVRGTSLQSKWVVHLRYFSCLDHHCFIVYVSEKWFLESFFCTCNFFVMAYLRAYWDSANSADRLRASQYFVAGFNKISGVLRLPSIFFWRLSVLFSAKSTFKISAKQGYVFLYWIMS